MAPLTRLAWAGMASLGLAILAGPAAAHPLGNTTVNRQAALAVGPQRVSLEFRMELAEIPSLAAEAEADDNGDGQVDAAEWRRAARRWAAEAQAGLSLRADGRLLAWRLEGAGAERAEGEAGLPLLRLRARYSAPLPAGTLALALRDGFRPQDRGWREMWARGVDGVAVEGPGARADRSHGLGAYPAGAPVPDERGLDLTLGLPPPVSPPPLTRSLAPQPVAAPAPAVVAGPGRPLPDAPYAQAPPGPQSAAPALDPEVGEERPPLRDAGPSLPAMFGLGMHHILTGYDHLAFLAGLLLISTGWRGAARVVTAFTLAHSLTLLLAASGVVAVPPAAVESAIALSVAWVGGLAITGRGQGHGFGLAFAFGLVHGLGFAGALAETLGPGAVSVLPLVAFNLGIEACQLALVAVVLGLVAVLARQAWAPAGLHRLASLLVTGGGLLWFVARVAG